MGDEAGASALSKPQAYIRYASFHKCDVEKIFGQDLAGISCFQFCKFSCNLVTNSFAQLHKWWSMRNRISVQCAPASGFQNHRQLAAAFLASLLVYICGLFSGWLCTRRAQLAFALQKRTPA